MPRSGGVQTRSARPPDGNRGGRGEREVRQAGRSSGNACKGFSDNGFQADTAKEMAGFKGKQTEELD